MTDIDGYCTVRAAYYGISQFNAAPQYLICAIALAVGPQNSYQVYIGQAKFENDCNSKILGIFSENDQKLKKGLSWNPRESGHRDRL